MAVPQVRWFPTTDRYIGTGHVWSHASRVANGLFIAQPADVVANSPFRRCDDVVARAGGDADGLSELSRLIRAGPIRYDAVRADRGAGLMTAGRRRSAWCLYLEDSSWIKYSRSIIDFIWRRRHHRPYCNRLNRGWLKLFQVRSAKPDAVNWFC